MVRTCTIHKLPTKYLLVYLCTYFLNSQYMFYFSSDVGSLTYVLYSVYIIILFRFSEYSQNLMECFFVISIHTVL